MAYKDNEPFLALGGKIDPLTEIRNAGIVTSGRVLWVKATADADYTTVKDAVGASFMYNNIQTAVNATRNDKNDYVMVIPKDNNGAYAPNEDVAGTALLLNKARNHVISVGYGKGLYGYTNTIRGFATASAYDTQLVKVTAPGVEIAGFRFLGTSGTTANVTLSNVMVIGTASSGTAANTWVHDTAVEANLASGGGANGTPTLVSIVGTTGTDGARFDNCTIGNSIGPGVCVALNAIGKRHTFLRSTFLTNAAATGDSMVTCGTGLTEFTLFKECEFVNLNSAAKNASAVTGSITTTNPMLLSYCTAVNVTAMGTDPTVLAAPNQSGTNAAGIHNPGIFFTGSAPITVA